MHMADALLSTPVALTGGAVAAALIGVAGSRIKRYTQDNLVPLMGVAGAFVFAAQMVNFSIPATGSSGHIVGGVLLAALLGPWAAFLTLASVLIIQCLVFADGGLMALGCNVVNMAAMSCLVAYPLVFRPIAGRKMSQGGIAVASLAACVAGLELGALLVTAETELSGITALPGSRFLALMAAIHLSIGFCEGLATAAVLMFVRKTRPDLLYSPDGQQPASRPGKALWWLAGATLLIAGGLAFLASSDPDGLEWSISRLTGDAGLPEAGSAMARGAEGIQQATAVMPDYDSSFSGVIGAVMVLALVIAFASLLTRRRATAVSHNGRKA